MKTAAVLCFFAALAFASARPEQYTDKYDNLDLDQIVSNRRLLVPYILCALEKGKCSPEGKELKSHIKEALENNCGKCTETQRSGTHRVIGYLINNEDKYWGELTAKYDPSRKYVAKYESDLRVAKTQG